MTAGPQRVVSLLPAATEIIAALGGWDRLVGVSHECDYPAEARALPCVTGSRVPGGSSREIDRTVRELSSTGQDLFVLDAEAIRALSPDLIVTQGLCEVCAVSETDVRRLAATLAGCHVISLGAKTLDDVLGTIHQLAAVLDLAAEGTELVDGLRYQMRQVQRVLERTAEQRPRVAVIEWTDPVFAAGHWVPDMVALAGGVDVLATSGQHSVVAKVERLLEAEPQVLVFAPCGFDVERAADEAEATMSRPQWAWAEDLEVWAMDGNALTSRPGPRLCTGVITLARLLHPGLFGAPLPDRARPVRRTSSRPRLSPQPA